MMRKSWIRKDQKGVSPVIATILMVAITVVLAAVLYLMVSNFGGDDTEVLSATITLEEKSGGQTECRFGTFSKTTEALDVDVTIINGTAQSKFIFDDTVGTDGAWVLDGTDNANVGGTSGELAFLDLSSDGKMNNGDSFMFYTDSSESYEVKIIVGGSEVCSDEIST